MGGISLPALHLNPPAPQQNPLEQIGQLLALKNQMANAPLQRQALQQQVQAGAQENQMRDTQMKDQQAMTTAMQQWDGKDLTQLPALVLKNGGSSTAVMGLKKQAMEMQKQYSDIAKTDAETGAKTIETKMKKNDMISGAFSTVLQAPDDQLPQAVMSTAQQLAQQGLLDPQHLQMAERIAQVGDPNQIRHALDTMRKGMLADSQLLAQAKETAQTGEATARANEATVNATLAPQKLANQQANDAAMRKQGAQRIGIESARLNFERQKAMLDQNSSTATGDAYLTTLAPGVQSQVKAIANGDIAIPPPGARNPMAQQLRTAVLQYDPTYTDARYKGKQDFKNKGDAQNIVQLSTAMEHADRAMTNSAKVGFAPALGNKTLEAPESAAYMQDAEFLTGEVGKLVKNGVLTVDESNKIQSGLTSARQSVRNAALEETMDLLGGKARAVFQKYKVGTGQDLPVSEFFDAKSQQRLQKYGIVEGAAPAQGGGGAAAGPATPQTHTFSLGAWQKGNPQGDPNAAKAAAQAQGFQVIQ